jgi:hypothetical protein
MWEAAEQVIGYERRRVAELRGVVAQFIAELEGIPRGPDH